MTVWICITDYYYDGEVEVKYVYTSVDKALVWINSRAKLVTGSDEVGYQANFIGGTYRIFKMEVT